MGQDLNLVPPEYRAGVQCSLQKDIQMYFQDLCHEAAFRIEMAYNKMF